MRRFDTVLFDLDGTLLDTLEDICGAANHTLRELGYPERTLAEMRRFVGNGAEMQMRRALGADADADAETVAKALALYKPYYAAHCQIKTKPYAGVLELMAALKAEGFRLAVVSNKPDEAVRPLVAQHFGALADIAMGETAQRRRKPAPDMVNDALAALPLILLERKASSRVYLEKYFLAHGVSLSPEIELGARSLLVDLARIGFGERETPCARTYFSRYTRELALRSSRMSGSAASSCIE